MLQIFEKYLVLSPNSWGNARFAPTADAYESMKIAHHISLKSKMSLKKFRVIWQP